jgi:hypothetical protein
MKLFSLPPSSLIFFPVNSLILIAPESVFLVLLQTMMLYVFLVVLAGQTCVHATKENLLFGIVPIIKESNVVFDESVFNFTILNPNAGKRLQKYVLLFPPHTSSTHGDAHIGDYMLLPVVPNVTNVHASHTSPTAIQ